MTTGTVLWRNGYFTWIAFVVDVPPDRLESRLGYARGALASGWDLLVPVRAIPADLIDLRGTTRWSDGVMPDGRSASEMLAQRGAYAPARAKVEAFFGRRWQNTPAKVAPLDTPDGYPPATEGIPQFRLLQKIEWSVRWRVPAGGMLSRDQAAAVTPYEGRST